MNLKSLNDSILTKKQITDIFGTPLNIGDIVLYCKNKGTASNGLQYGSITNRYDDLLSVRLDTCKVPIEGKNCIKADILFKHHGINTKSVCNTHKVNTVKNSTVYLFYCVLNNNEDGICLFKPEFAGTVGFESAVVELQNKYDGDINIFPVGLSFTLGEMLGNTGQTNASLNFSKSNIIKLNRDNINTIKFPFEYNKVIPFCMNYVTSNNIYIDFCNTNFDKVFLNLIGVKAFYNMVITFWNSTIPYIFNLPANSLGATCTYKNIVESDIIKNFNKYKDIEL